MAGMGKRILAEDPLTKETDDPEREIGEMKLHRWWATAKAKARITAESIL